MANHGVGHPPKKLLDALLKAKLPGVNARFLGNQFTLIEGLTSAGEHARSVLDEEALVVVLLEGLDLGPDRIVPIEVALLHALSQRTASDPHRWFILHELAKRIGNEELVRLLLEATGELRHRPISWLLETHYIKQLPAELVQKMSGILQFKCTSHEDFQKLKELCWMFRGVDFERISRLPRGVCYGAFRTATDPLLMRTAQELNIRPSTVWAKGETQQVA